MKNLDSDEEILELFKKYFIHMYEENLEGSAEIEESFLKMLNNDLDKYINLDDYEKFSREYTPQNIDEVVETEIDLWDIKDIKTVKS